ncbi:MAG: hypothetical protein JO000_15940 [Alphaproteobacteria bacterium]|nr:hypothetical protein [Alphaproteobacteria bacterium]
MDATSRQPSFAALVGLAWALIVLQLLAQHWADTAVNLLDTDDAMRLTQLRDWLGGQSWYDLHQWRVTPGYVSHWSRLIDVGLAGTLWFCALFFDGALAERLMRTVWPMLWLAPTLVGMTAIAWRIAGREAALVALLLALVGLPAFHQFRPGRIDHHNVQIALSVLVVAATVWSDRVRWAALAAGALTALAIGVGLECLPYLLVCALAFALRYALDPSGARPAVDYGIALAAGAIALFFLLVGPQSWSVAVCDAIAINWVALVGIGGFGLAVAGYCASPRLAVRLGCTLAIGAVATAVFLAIEPRCLKGPYAMMDAQVWSIWLSDVREMQPLLTLIVKTPVTGLAVAAFPVAALVATLVLLRDRAARRDFAALTASAAFAVAFLTTLAAVKAYSYATWLGMPLVAALALHLFAALHVQRLIPRVALSLLLTPAVLSVGALGIAQAAGLNDKKPADGPDRPAQDACLDNASYAALARLPAGIVAADLDYGPFLLALTPHRILAAPYHRLSAGILATHEVFGSAPAAAHAALKRLGVTYVATCGTRGPSDLPKSELEASFAGRLRAKEVPDWLEPVAVGDSPFTVYRVKS